MIIDAHVHVGGPPPEAEPENFVKLIYKSRIDKSIICRYIDCNSRAAHQSGPCKVY